MSWKQWTASRKLLVHAASKQEIDGLRLVIARDLRDAAIPGLSEDRRFATAYNAALQSAKMALACAGYRVAAVPGHHALHFEAARLALGDEAAPLVDFFEVCRRKRNVIDYTGAQIASATEAAEVLQRAAEFLAMVEAWIEQNHSEYAS